MRRKTLLLVLAATAAVPAPAAAAPTKPCIVAGCDEQRADNADSNKRSSCPVPATIVCAGGAVIGGAVDAVGDAAGAGVAAAGDAVMGGLTNWVAGGASWLLERADKLLAKSSKPALGSTWFQRQYQSMIGFAVALSMLFLLCALLKATLKHDVAALVKSALVALPLSLLLCFAAVTLVESALGVTDWMTASVLQHFGDDTHEFFSDVSEVLVPSSLTGSPLPGFLLFLGAMLTALATFVVWLELIMREAAIYVAVAFLPLCFAAMIWDKTAHWCRKLVELLAALILAKLTIAVAVSLAAGAMAHGRGGEGGLTALMAGCAVMVIAAFTPWMLLRLVPIAEAAGHMAIHRGAAKSAIGTAPGAQTAAMVARQSVLVAATPGAGGMAAARHQMLAAKPASPPAPPVPQGGNR